MEHKIIAIYCLIDEMLKGLHVKNDVRAKITNAEMLTMVAHLAVRAEISNAEVLLIGYMAVNDFNGNYFKAHQYVKMMHLVKEIDYVRFLSHLVKINNVLSTLFLFLGLVMTKKPCCLTSSLGYCNIIIK